MIVENWFLAKIKYLKQNEDGTIKSKTEEFVLNSLSHTEAEARLQGLLESTIAEYDLKALNKLSIQDCVIDESKDYFFKVKAAFIIEDADSGKEKKQNELYLIQANSGKEAYQKMEERLKGSILDFEIPSVMKTKISECFPYIEEG